MNVTFHGVRGSTPCSCEANRRYGGNTACVSIESPGSDPIVFDMGTGLRFFGETQPEGEPFRAHALVSHLHWDHVQGLPFCVPLHTPGAQLDVYGPMQEGLTVAQGFEEFMRLHGIEMIHGGECGLRFTPSFGITSAEIDLIVSVIRKGLKEMVLRKEAPGKVLAAKGARSARTSRKGKGE